MSVITLEKNMRQQFLAKLSQLASGFTHAWIKPFYSSLQDLPAGSDLDLLIRGSDLPRWKERLGSIPELKKVVYVDRMNVCDCELYFVDGTYLSLDLIHDLRRKQYRFMDAEAVLDRSVLHVTGLKACSPKDSFEYLLLFFGLNHSPVPPKYLNHFSMLPTKEQKAISRYLQSMYLLPDMEALEMMSEADKITPYLKSALKEEPANQNGKLLSRWFQVWKDTFRHPAPTLTFSGVDGAGKSTIISRVKDLLEQKYRRKVVVLRHRPSLLPILSSYRYGKKQAESRAAQNLPRQGGNQSKIGSVVRFAYYYMDYLFGQFYVKMKYNMRGYTVLYDRYYFDFIADPKRSNLLLSQSLTRPLFRLLMKPELNVLLYARPEDILARKQELTAVDIEELTQSYTSLFEDMQQGSSKASYLSLLNIDLDNTLARIEKAYIHLQ